MSDDDKVIAFGERFTRDLNAAGEPVERSLHEMTSAEVLLALDWSRREADRLVAEVEVDKSTFDAAMKLIRARHYTSVKVSQDDMERMQATAEASLAAKQKSMRLIGLVMTSMPLWERQPELTLEAAIRRFWPEGNG